MGMRLEGVLFGVIGWGDLSEMSGKSAGIRVQEVPKGDGAAVDR